MKYLLLAFRGELMCFNHVLLYAREIREKGGEALIIIEGEATALVPRLMEEGQPFATLFRETVEAGSVESVCRACSAKMGVLEQVEASGLPVRGDLSGHPSITGLIGKGYHPLSF